MTIFKDDLERVYALIEDEKRWTTGAYARDAAGELVPNDERDTSPDDEDAPLRDGAACWCLYGAAIKCRIPKWQHMEDALGVSALADWNDTHTHAEVLALLRSAINRAPSRPATEQVRG